MNTNNTTTLTTTILTEKDLIRPLHTLPNTVIITKELLLLRLVIANLNITANTPNTDAWHDSLNASDCCRWDLEGFLQN
jgi:hypothetical protein